MAKYYSIESGKTEKISTPSMLTKLSFIVETKSKKVYFFNLNAANEYVYRGNGSVTNKKDNSQITPLRQEKAAGFVTIKSVDSIFECAVSGLNGAIHKFDEYKCSVTFSRPDGEYVLRVYDADANRTLRKFKVNGGEVYSIIKAELCVNMSTNSIVPLFTGEDQIAAEAKRYEALVTK